MQQVPIGKVTFSLLEFHLSIGCFKKQFCAAIQKVFMTFFPNKTNSALLSVFAWLFCMYTDISQLKALVSRPVLLFVN